MDCRSVEKLLQRAVAGLPVTQDELEEALGHARTCELCARRFEVGPRDAYLEQRDSPDMAEPVEPIALFERALTAALSDPEPIVRVRAAQRLGGFEQLGPRTLAGLAQAAADDPEEEVRTAALVALDLLDDAVSLPQRVIEAWSATPAEAAPYLADCLSRLAHPGSLASLRVAQLVPEATGAGDELAVRGADAAGRIVREQDELWLRLNRLPGSFEKATPVVAVPAALGKQAPRVQWSGESPGLVPARDPVAHGSLDILLGNVPDPSKRALSKKLFARLYLLDPRKRRSGI